MDIRQQILIKIERMVYFSMLVDKYNEIMGKGVYSGTFVAPEQFDKYFCLNNLYSERGLITDSIQEIQPDLSVRNLAKYCNQRLSGVRTYDGYVSRQDNLGACGYRVIHVAYKTIPIPPERSHTIQEHLNIAKEGSKSYVIFCYDQLWSGLSDYVQDVKYADEMQESIDYCKNWLLMRQHSKCWCHIFVYGYEGGMYILPYYKDVDTVSEDDMRYDAVVKLYRYNYFIKLARTRYQNTH